MGSRIIGGDKDIPYDEGGCVNFDDVWEAVKDLNMSILARGGGDIQYGKPEFSISRLEMKPCFRVRGVVKEAV